MHHPYKIERSIYTYQVCRYVDMYVVTKLLNTNRKKQKEKTEKERKKKYTRVLWVWEVDRNHSINRN